MLQYPKGGEGCERRPTRYLYVSPVNLRGGLPTLSSTLRSILVSLVILFLPNFFFPLSFLSFFPSYRYTLISHLSLTSSLFSFYIFLATSSPLSLSLVVFDDIRSSLFYNLSFSSPLFAVSFTHTYTHIYIHARFILHSLYSGHTKTNCHSIRPLFEAWRKFPTAFPVKPPPHPRTNRRGFPPLGTSDLPSLPLLSLSLSIALHRDGQTVIIGEGSDYSKERIDPPECFSRKLYFFFFFECFLSMIRWKWGFYQKNKRADFYKMIL